MEQGGDWWNRETDNHWDSGAILSDYVYLVEEQEGDSVGANLSN